MLNLHQPKSLKSSILKLFNSTTSLTLKILSKLRSMNLRNKTSQQKAYNGIVEQRENAEVFEKCIRLN